MNEYPLRFQHLSGSVGVVLLCSKEPTEFRDRLIYPRVRELEQQGNANAA